MRTIAAFLATVSISLSFTSPATAQLQLIAKAQNATERVDAMQNYLRSIAVTADGRLWTLTYFNDGLGNGATSQFLRLHASSDQGKTWSIATSVRTPGPYNGSLVTGTDGRLLHLAWRALNGNAGYGIYYGTFHTRSMQWVGTDLELAKGVDANNQFLDPVIDVTWRGVIGVCYYTHRQGPWAGQLRVQKGGTFSVAQTVNVDTYGFLINMQAHGDDFHLAYRTNAGLYGIRYRRFDTNTMTFGAEGEVMVSQANPLGSPASSGNCLAVAPNGDVYIVYASGASTAGSGVVWLAYAPAGTYAFTTHTKVADDPPLQGGNFNYAHYSLAIGADGTIQVLYSLAAETFAKLWWRFTTGGGGLGPQVPLATLANDSFQWISGSRIAHAKLGMFATVADRSVPGGQATCLQATGGLASLHGSACQGAATSLPQLGARALPGLGQTLNLDMRSLGASANGALALGAGDQQLGLVPLPLELGILGAPGCWLTQDLLVTLPFTANAQGVASISLAVPSSPSIAGLPFFSQSLVFAPGANAGGLLMTNGLALIVR